GLEQLLHPGQTGGDVLTRDATLMEGTHSQLGSRLADGLRGHDADRLTHIDELAGGHGPAIAHRAHPTGRLAGQYRAHLDPPDTGGHQHVDRRVTEVRTQRHEHRAGAVDHVLRGAAGVYAGLHVTVPGKASVRTRVDDGHLDPALGAAIMLPHDDVLRD